MRAAPILAIAAAAIAACGRSAPDLRRMRLEAERRQLAASLDRLEDRLIVDQARVRFWKEMRARHESVTAIACTSQERHAEEMLAHGVDPARPDVPLPPPHVVARWMPPESRRPTLGPAAVTAGPATPPGGTIAGE